MTPSTIRHPVPYPHQQHDGIPTPEGAAEWPAAKQDSVHHHPSNCSSPPALQTQTTPAMPARFADLPTDPASDYLYPKKAT